MSCLFVLIMSVSLLPDTPPSGGTEHKPQDNYKLAISFTTESSGLEQYKEHNGYLINWIYKSSINQHIHLFVKQIFSICGDKKLQGLRWQNVYLLCSNFPELSTFPINTIVYLLCHKS